MRSAPPARRPRPSRRRTHPRTTGGPHRSSARAPEPPRPRLAERGVGPSRVLVPILVVLILAKTDAASTLAAVVFVLGAMSDGLDGYLARRHGTSTRTGQWLDPLADKFLVAAPVITLAAIGRFPAW